VRIRKVCRLEAESASVSVHLLDEILHRLVGWNAPLIHIVLTVVLFLVFLVLGLGGFLSGFFLLCTDRAASDRWSACLPGLTVLFIIFVPSSNLKQVLSKVLRKAYTGIIATRQH